MPPTADPATDADAEKKPAVKIRWQIAAMGAACVAVAAGAKLGGAAERAIGPAMALVIFAAIGFVLLPLGVARMWSRKFRHAVGWLVVGLVSVAIMLIWPAVFLCFVALGICSSLGLVVVIAAKKFSAELVRHGIVEAPKSPPPFATAVSPPDGHQAENWLERRPPAHFEFGAKTTDMLPFSNWKLLAEVRMVVQWFALVMLICMLVIWMRETAQPALKFAHITTNFDAGQADAARDLANGEPVEWRSVWGSSWQSAPDLTGQCGPLFGLPQKPFMVRRDVIKTLADFQFQPPRTRKAPAYVRGYHHALRQWRAIHGSIPNAIPPTDAPQTARK